ncbi:protein of unknown function [Taphrina deformans PYCC 5710]|uniref:Tyrosine specific protein phosphatases domain-containing protein n=1 Tax=Taphrina deformans (strain PYCC 5710 / ATCC 11124 / CBS 356.35 / IMI 108563 / JCM 9778 / NBRC 8474) TaxID=1097556 RepID=R4XF48_TAPDE|nr:protein of unknown function [Taphrina deformans PYCC 5710]|eukprot:CCG84492.1 protein of unknown function [Taphrina deformans PYCC 5710]
MEIELQIPSSNPTFSQFTSIGASLYVPENTTSPNRIVIIVHGHAGHRDYCYQKLLSRALTVPSLRFDFSGCGYQLGSGTLPGREASETPRTIESDLHDLRTVVSHVRSQGYFVSALVGHSRGSVVCLQYVRTDPSIPTVVNCSGRFRAHLIHEKVRRNPHLREGATGYWEKHRAGTGGELVNKWTLLSEIASVGAQEMYGIGDALSHEINVLIVFGSRDNIVPVADAGMFVNELGERAELAMIEDADHNFFVQPQDKAAKKVNKNQEVADIIAQYLSAERTRLRFLKRKRELRSPRFPSVDGMSNFRDLGGYGSFPTGLFYRGADLSSLTSKGAEQLSHYISHIIDLRAEPEVEMNGTIGPVAAQPLDIPGIERIHDPIFRHIDYSPTGLRKFFGTATRTAKEKRDGMVKAYKVILKHAKPVFTTIFSLLADIIRQSAARGIMIHCSAGKDRTGVICAMFLVLAGIDPETIALEYELTTYGLDERKLRHSALLPDDKSAEAADPAQDAGNGSDAETMRVFLQYVAREIDADEYFASCVDAQQLQVVRDYLRGITKSRL